MNPTPQQLRREEQEQALIRISHASSNFVNVLVSIFGSSSSSLPTTPTSIDSQDQQRPQMKKSTNPKGNHNIIPPVLLPTRMRRDPSRRIRFVDEDEAETELGTFEQRQASTVLEQENKQRDNVPSTPFNSAGQGGKTNNINHNHNKNTSTTKKLLSWSVQRHYLHVSQNRDGLNPTTYSTLINPQSFGSEFLTFPSDKHVFPIRPGSSRAIFPHHQQSSNNNKYANVGDAVDAANFFPRITCPDEAMRSITQDMMIQEQTRKSILEEGNDDDEEAEVETTGDALAFENSDYSWLDAALVSPNDASSQNYSERRPTSKAFTNMLLSGTLATSFKDENNSPARKNNNGNVLDKTASNFGVLSSSSSLTKITTTAVLSTAVDVLQLRHPLHRGMTQISCEDQDSRPAEPPQKQIEDFPKELYEKIVVLLDAENLNDDSIGLANLVFWDAVDMEISRKCRIEMEARAEAKRRAEKQKRKNVFGVQIPDMPRASLSDDGTAFGVTDNNNNNHDDDDEDEDRGTEFAAMNTKNRALDALVYGNDNLLQIDGDDNDYDEDTEERDGFHLHQQIELIDAESLRIQAGTIAAFEISKILFDRLMWGIKALCGGCFHRRHFNAIQSAIDDAVKEIKFRNRNKGRGDFSINNNNNMNNADAASSTSFQDSVFAVALFALLRDSYEVCEKIFCANLAQEDREFRQWKKIKEERRQRRLEENNPHRNKNENSNDVETNQFNADQVPQQRNNSNSSTTLTNQELLQRKIHREIEQMANDDMKQTLTQFEVRQRQQQQISKNQVVQNAGSSSKDRLGAPLIIVPLSTDEILNTQKRERNQLEKPYWTTIFTEPMFSQDPTLRIDVENVFLLRKSNNNNKNVENNNGNDEIAVGKDNDLNAMHDNNENMFDEWIFETTERGKTRYTSVPTILQCPLLTLILLFARPNRWSKKSKQDGKAGDVVWF